MSQQSNSKIAEKKQAAKSPTQPVKGSAVKSTASLVYERNAFYREGYRRAWLVAKIVSVYSLLITLLAAFLALQSPGMEYFATTQDGRTIKLQPLSKPNQSDVVVSEWAAKALVDTFNYNYSDYGDRLNSSRSHYFTKVGGSELIRALNSGGIIDDVVEGGFFASLALTKDPVIVAKSTGAVAAWKMQAPVVLTYRNKDGVSSQKILVEITIVRRNTLEQPSGLGISKIIMLPA